MRRVYAVRAFLVAAVLMMFACWAAPSASAATSDPGYSLLAADGSVLDGQSVLSPVAAHLGYPDGASIAKVKFYIDGAYLGQIAAAPYEWTYALPLGAHALEARATTAAGTRTARAVVTAVEKLPPPPPPPASSNPACPSYTVTTAAELAAALASATPGQTIVLADGVYAGNFVAAVDGTEQAPITLCGGRNARIVSDDGNDGGSYALYLNGADWWHLTGFTVATAKKGLVLDWSSHDLVEDLHVTDIGDEGIHLRRDSSDNIIRGNTVDHTGMVAPRFGEGVYVGSAVSNWGLYMGLDSAGSPIPDRSDRNQIIGNTVIDTAAENVDVKEGTTSGTVSGNTFGGDLIAGENSADSLIDVKGNGWQIENNIGHHAAGLGAMVDGFEIHEAAPGWGRDNAFHGNAVEVNAPGVGIWVHPSLLGAGNILGCDNTWAGAAGGDYATNHDPYVLLACE
ncbi:NosD domain-containing protein [Frankia sp. Cj3]|uniref:NosD domain-containing protein n=1 Tax=Frankia sp. Cj3 TaxID=2880976 RepID=UPI001EF703E4|nr:right-handed parallel beta-helix repeat-containing protein [Frankia sp. Cj3]